MDEQKITQFRELIWNFYHDHGRHKLAWRVDPSPYNVFISEIMLQQTQVSRVQTKYWEWLEQFPNFTAVAEAGVAEVVAAWSGLGYNSRALRLRLAAQMVQDEFGGVLPRDPDALVRLPGIGPNTAGSMAAFAYDEPVVFIETNIRRVFIHEFFTEREGGEPVHDRELLPLVAATLERDSPREWYWALMDYGSDLAKRVPNPNRRSHHYARQSQFEGSARQVRGEILRRLIGGPKPVAELAGLDPRAAGLVTDLEREGFVVVTAEQVRLA